MRLVAIFNYVCLLIFALSLGGCLPSGDAVDEQKDPHYLNGRTRVSSLDYKGAIEEFEKAVETNPHSAAAHFELGLLYQDRIQDFARAIYHYDRHLELRPKSEYADTIQQRIKACKSDLVKSEFLAPVNQGMQRDLEKLTSENMQLKQRLQALEAQLANRPPIGNGETSTPISRQSPLVSNTESNKPSAPSSEQLTSPRASRETHETPHVSRPKTHTVKSGETVSSIAKQYGLKLETLLKANPKVSARQLKVGQTLVLPNN